MVTDLVTSRQALPIPSDLAVVLFLLGRPTVHHADSNGCAAGNTLEEAIVQGFLELVERDAYAIWWYNRLQRPEVDLSQFNDSYLRDLQCSLPKSDVGFGCSTSPAISGSNIHRDDALDR